MALSYDELTTPPTEDEQLTTLLELATLAGFPATSWQSGSVPRTLLQVQATVLAELAVLIRDIGRGGLLDDAEGDWLDLLVESLFDESRIQAVRTRGNALLACAATAGPYTIAIGQLVATDPAGKEFRNITGGTVSSGGSLALEFEATEPGAAYNLAPNTLTILLTPIAGVTIDNPVVPPATTWITQAGADEESDDQLRERCRAKWATQGTGATTDSYVFWAREASSQVRRVHVLEHSDQGTATDGHVTLYLASEVGTVDAQAVTDVSAYIAERRPLCTTVHVVAATQVIVPITCTITVRAEDKAAAEAIIGDYLDELQASIDIGSTVYTAAIIEQLMRPQGVINAVLVAPAADVALDFDEVAVFNAPAISWVEV